MLLSSKDTANMTQARMIRIGTRATEATMTVTHNPSAVLVILIILLQIINCNKTRSYNALRRIASVDTRSERIKPHVALCIL